MLRGRNLDKGMCSDSSWILPHFAPWLECKYNWEIEQTVPLLTYSSTFSILLCVPRGWSSQPQQGEFSPHPSSSRKLLQKTGGGRRGSFEYMFSLSFYFKTLSLLKVPVQFSCLLQAIPWVSGFGNQAFLLPFGARGVSVPRYYCPQVLYHSCDPPTPCPGLCKYLPIKLPSFYLNLSYLSVACQDSSWYSLPGWTLWKVGILYAKFLPFYKIK